MSSKHTLMLWGSRIVFLLNLICTQTCHAEVTDSDRFNLTLKAQTEYECKTLTKPVEKRVRPDFYRRVLGCHQVWQLTQGRPIAERLGKKADLSKMNLIVLDEEAAFVAAEGEVLQRFTGQFPLNNGRIDLYDANLQGTYFGERKSAPLVNFAGALLYGATFQTVNLKGINFGNSDCRTCEFFDSDLTGARFYLARLDFATMSNTKLAGATFDSATLNGLKFDPDPTSMPVGSSFVSSRLLRNLTFSRNSRSNAAILALREEIRKTGNKDTLREINYAIKADPKNYRSRGDYIFNSLIFGQTIGYGLHLLRPIIILIICIPFFAFLYLLSMAVRSNSAGVFVVWDKEPIDKTPARELAEQLTVDQPFPGVRIADDPSAPCPAQPIEKHQSKWNAAMVAIRTLVRWGCWESEADKKTHRRSALAMAIVLALVISAAWAYIDGLGLDEPIWLDPDASNSRAFALTLLTIAIFLSLWAVPYSRVRKSWQMAMWFSVLSAFRFGWRDLSLGTWLALVQPQEYSLRGNGWVKSLAGVQSIIGLFLVALWAVCYFIGPLE